MDIPSASRSGGVSRRELLRRCAVGFGQLALADLLTAAAQAEGPAGQPLAPRPPLFPARARRVIFLFMHGGPSHVDTFDDKPLLVRDSGRPLPFAKPRVQFAQTGNLRRSAWAFHAHGQSGARISELFPRVARHADDLCFIKSIHGTNAAHGGALLKLHTGSDTFVRPSMGSWISYGLGTENQNLPSFITIQPTTGHGGVANWSSAFLPAVHHGTSLRGPGGDMQKATINYLHDPDENPARQRAQLDFLSAMNRELAERTGPDAALEARIESFELAFRMQTEAPELLRVDDESPATRQLYGLDNPRTAAYGRQLLLARRFAEKGVRFIQCTHPYWDSHEKLTEEHGRLAAEVDWPIAGLLTDLKARGLLDDTLVLWGGEFGRTPTVQGNDGRDHNPHGFTMWLAGGGARAGYSHGRTDDYGFYAAEQKVHIHDLHATLLALLGLDHLRLTYRHAGRDFRLTDIEGDVVREVLV